MTDAQHRSGASVVRPAGTPDRTDLGVVLNSTPEPQTTDPNAYIEVLARLLCAADVHVHGDDHPTWKQLVDEPGRRIRDDYRKAARWLQPRMTVAAETRLSRAEKRCDELRAESKRRGKTVLEYSERIRALEREVDGLQKQLGAEILRADQAAAVSAVPPAQERRDLYAALFRHPPGGERLGDATPGEIADAVLAVRDAEMDQLRRERDLAIAHDRQPYPTAWAFEQACAALHRKEEAIERVRAVLETEAVVGRSALEYRGLIVSALMAEDPSVAPAAVAEQPTMPPPSLTGAAELEEKLDVDVTRLTGAALTADEAVGEQPDTNTPRELAAMLEGFGRLLATSSRDWGQYAPDAWLYAVLLGWDCEKDVHGGETCTHGAMEEMRQRHGWSNEAVAKARRYRAVVRAVTESAAVAQPGKEPTPCSVPTGCDAETGEPCERHEREQSHADNDHSLCRRDECEVLRQS